MEYGKNWRQDPRENVSQHTTMEMLHIAWLQSLIYVLFIQTNGRGTWG